MNEKSDQALHQLIETTDIADGIIKKLTKDVKFHMVLKNIIKEAMDESLKAINENMEKIQGDIFELQIENERLKVSNKELTCKFEQLKESEREDRLCIIDVEQHSRRNCVLISGIREKTPEKDSDGKPVRENTDKVVLDLVKEKLGIELKEEDIDHTYRVQHHNMYQNKPGRPRPVVVKFVRYNIRQKIMSSRRELKETGIGMHDFLTHGRQRLLQITQNLVKHVKRAKACWTWDGNVTVLIDLGGGQEKRIGVNSIRDLEFISYKYGDQN